MQPITASSPGSRPESGRRSLVGERAVLAWDGAPVGAGLGIAELRREARFDFVAEHVLELAGLFVDLVPGQIEIVGQEALAQAVAAHERGALDLPRLGQGDPVHLARLFHKAGRAQTTEHLGDGGRSDAELDRRGASR